MEISGRMWSIKMVFLSQDKGTHLTTGRLSRYSQMPVKMLTLRRKPRFTFSEIVLPTFTGKWYRPAAYPGIGGAQKFKDNSNIYTCK